MRRALAMAVWAAMMVGLSGCALEGLSSLDSEGYDSQEKRDWFDRFYGAGSSSDPNCSFWGNCNAPAAASEAKPADDCAFYGTCKSKKSSGWW